MEEREGGEGATERGILNITCSAQKKKFRKASRLYVQVRMLPLMSLHLFDSTVFLPNSKYCTYITHI